MSNKNVIEKLSSNNNLNTYNMEKLQSVNCHNPLSISNKAKFKEKSNEEIIDSINPEYLKNAQSKIQMMSEETRNNLRTSISWFFLPDNLKKIT